MRPALGVATSLAGAALVACQVVGGIEERRLAPAAVTPPSVEAGTTETSAAPPRCSEGTCVHTVATGSAFTCSREADARIRCWGANDRGQAGDGTTNDRKDPRFVAGITAATDVWAGVDFVCARLVDGTASCWGSNLTKALGDPSFTAYYRARPGLVPGLTGVRELALGEGHICARTPDGVSCWGGNGYGQTGHIGKAPRPLVVSELGSDVAQIAAGGWTSCALRGDGSVWCWGFNDAGQLANGTRTSTTIPVKISGLGPAARVAMSSDRVCVVLRDGTVWCWGGSVDSDAGPPPSPLPVANVSGATDIALGTVHTCASTRNEQIVCWGTDLDGQLGRGRTGDGAPQSIRDLTISAFDLGGNHTCARSTAGVLFCWGSNERGELGDGSTTAQYSPTEVLAP